MLRLSRAPVIRDIERFIGRLTGCLGEQSWNAHGVACRRTRPDHSGGYAIDLEVTHIEAEIEGGGRLRIVHRHGILAGRP